MVQISVQNFTEADMSGYLEMSCVEYGASVTTTDPDHVRWKHLKSPFGASSYVSLIENNRIVGRGLIQPRTLLTVGKSSNVASVMDLLINREHRTTPVHFIKLTKACGNVCKFDLIFHTSNERTFPLYSKLLRFPNPFSLQAYGFPVRLAGLLSSMIGKRVDALDWFTAPLRWLLQGIAYAAVSMTALDISEQMISDGELEKLSEKCLRQYGPHLARTNEFLKWRFVDAPLWPAAVYRIDGNGLFLGYVVTRKMTLGNLNHLVLMDFLIDPDASLWVCIALRLWLIGQAITSRADTLFTMINPLSAFARKCVAFPFISIPEKFLPHATPIFLREGADKSLGLDRTMHLTLGDLDYF
jgi:hypothetical protein